MQEQVIKRSKSQLALFALISIITVIGGLYILYRNQATPGLFFAIGGIIIFFATLHSYRLDEAVVVMDKEGITLLAFRVGKIVWNDIRAVTIEQPPRMGKIICLELLDETKYLKRQIDPPPGIGRKIDRLYGLSTFHIMTSSLEVSAETLYQDIQQYRKRNSQQISTSS